jgi:tetratricopeptide (TPR) repeat protein
VKLLLIALFLCLACPCAVKAAPTPQSSPAQVTGILNHVEGRLSAQRDYYWHQGDYPRIIALDRILTEMDPHFLDCYETGGWLMDSLGDTKDAEAYYRLGVANNPRVEVPYYGLGFFYFNTLHKYRLAASVFHQGALLPGENILDWKMVAHSYEHAQEYDKAVATWKYIKIRWPHGLVVDQNLKRAEQMQAAANAMKPATQSGTKAL